TSRKAFARLPEGAHRQATLFGCSGRPRRYELLVAAEGRGPSTVFSARPQGRNDHAEDLRARAGLAAGQRGPGHDACAASLKGAERFDGPPQLTVISEHLDRCLGE